MREMSQAAAVIPQYSFIGHMEVDESSMAPFPYTTLPSPKIRLGRKCDNMKTICWWVLCWPFCKWWGECDEEGVLLMRCATDEVCYWWVVLLTSWRWASRPAAGSRSLLVAWQPMGGAPGPWLSPFRWHAFQRTRGWPCPTRWPPRVLMRCATDEVCYWWGVLLMRCATDEVCCWWSVLLMRCAADEVCYWWGVLLMKCAADEVCYWWGVLLMRCAADEVCYLLVYWSLF